VGDNGNVQPTDIAASEPLGTMRALDELVGSTVIMKPADTHTTKLFGAPGARSHARGFTLVELLAVLAMIGILAALALVGYRRYLNASRSGDAKAIISSIRIAEESYRAETLSYANCSADDLTKYYPIVEARLNGKKMIWRNSSHEHFDCWKMLNVVTDSPTRYGFAVVAGAPGKAMPEPSTNNKPTWPTPTEPWYVIQAAGDNDDDDNYALFVTSSLNGEIYSEREEE
jgi:type IV pilus assembly protein PilA